MYVVLSLIVTLVPLFIAAAQPNPDTLWTARIGGTNTDYGHAIRQTTDGGYIIAGETNSFGSHQVDAYTVRLNASGIAQWQNSYGAFNESSSNSFADVEQTTDEGFIMVGRAVHNNRAYAYVVKTDADGDTAWTRTFSDPQATIDVSARAVLPTEDNGYLIAGYALSVFPTHGYVCLFKTNSAGDTVWTHLMREREVFAYEACEAIAPATGGGYLLAGNCYPEGSNNTDGLLMRVNATGRVERSRYYGYENYDAFNSVAECANGGYILAGTSYVDENRAHDIYIVRTDVMCDTIWTKRIGGPNDDRAMSVHEATDGFIIGGRTRSSGAGNDDFYLLKLDADGEQLWSRTYGGSEHDWCDAMQSTDDGGYVLCGSTASFGAQDYDLYAVKTGPDPAGSECPTLCVNAAPITVNVPVTQCSFQADGQHWFRIQLAEGEYRFQLDGFSGSTDYDFYTFLSCTDVDPTSCSSFEVGTENMLCQVTGSVELYVEVVTYSGPYGSYRLLVSSTSSETQSAEPVPTEFSLSAYPNPFNPITTIAFALPQTESVKLAVFDISGRLIQTLLNTRIEAGRHEVEFDGRALPSGVYLAQIRTGSFVQTHKIILLR